MCLNIFFKYLAELTYENIWSWTSTCWEYFLNYWCNFTIGNCSIHIFIFLPDSNLEYCSFLGIYPLCLSCPFDWHIIIILCISMVLCVTSLFLLLFYVFINRKKKWVTTLQTLLKHRNGNKGTHKWQTWTGMVLKV